MRKAKINGVRNQRFRNALPVKESPAFRTLPGAEVYFVDRYGRIEFAD